MAELDDNYLQLGRGCGSYRIIMMVATGETCRRDLLGAVWRHRFLISILCLIGGVLGFSGSFLMTPVFRATVVVAPVDKGKINTLSQIAGQVGGIFGMAGAAIGLSSSIDESVAVETLRSGILTARFINMNGLMPELYPNNYISGSEEMSDDAPTEYDAVRKFDSEIRRVVQDRRSRLVTLSIEWKDPQVAANWANSLIDTVNDYLRAEAIRESQGRLEFLQEQYQATTLLELRQGISRLMEAEIKQVMLAKTMDQYAFSVIDPAIPPDSDDPVRPRRALLLILGILAGGFLGLTVSVYHNLQGSK